MIRRQVAPAALMALALTVLLGLIYPLTVTAIAQVTMSDQANGSLITVEGKPVGSRLIGQRFEKDIYFHSRPSAAGLDGYDAQASGGSNLGPTNPDLIAAVTERVNLYRSENYLDPGQVVPIDAVTASGSGLDPHISLANAKLQIRRVSAARNISESQVAALVDRFVEGRDLGVLGQPHVNVLELNLALDRQRG